MSYKPAELSAINATYKLLSDVLVEIRFLSNKQIGLLHSESVIHNGPKHVETIANRVRYLTDALHNIDSLMMAYTHSVSNDFEFFMRLNENSHALDEMDKHDVSQFIEPISKERILQVCSLLKESFYHNNTAGSEVEVKL